MMLIWKGSFSHIRYLLMCTHCGAFQVAQWLKKKSLANSGDSGEVGLIPGLGRSPGGGKWQPTPVFLPQKFHGQRSLAGYSPWGRKESYVTKWLSTHTVLSWGIYSETQKGAKTWEQHSGGKSTGLYSQQRWNPADGSSTIDTLSCWLYRIF